MRVGKIMHAKRDLSQMILALRTPRSLAGGLHRGQEKRDQDTNDGNHNQ